MKILLTGANGQIGSELRGSLATLGEVHCATRDGRLIDGTPCEVANLDHPSTLTGLVHRAAPDVVVNAAAYTAVDRAESERETAFRVNEEAVAALARACAARDTLLVHYSTDYVFPGDTPRPRREDDPTDPVSVYGASKLAGEEAIRASGCRHLVFRISWVYAAHGHNFLRTMLRMAGEREELRVVDDQIGTPTPAHWIAEATSSAIAAVTGPDSHRPKVSIRRGTWHLAPSGEASWHGFAEAIFANALQAGLIIRPPTVIPVPTSDYPTLARRPPYSRLDTTKLEHDFGITLPDWRQGLSEVIASLPPALGM